ncbi:MAG: DUF4129 domain-containing protein [Aeropyrum sp.]|nr:DUF4129 domain-containing protein [Aeropyrum sp.]
MIPPEGRHYIPPPVFEGVQQGSPPSGGEGVGEATITNFLPPAFNISGPDPNTSLLVFLVALAAIAVVLIFASGRTRYSPSSIPWIVGKPFSPTKLWGYIYPGRKKELRMALEEMARKAASQGARITRSMTAMEIAAEAARHGVASAREVAQAYYKGVFGMREPGEDLVRRVWRLVRG